MGRSSGSTLFRHWGAVRFQRPGRAPFRQRILCSYEKPDLSIPSPLLDP